MAKNKKLKKKIRKLKREVKTLKDRLIGEILSESVQDWVRGER